MSRMTVITDPNADHFAKVEQFSNHLITIDSIHAQIHAGAFFTGGLTSASVANGGVLEILIQTPAASVGFIHLRGQAYAGGDFTIEWFEGTTFSVAGTAFAPSQRNRTSANVMNGTFTHTPTTTLDGTALFTANVVGGSGGQASGGLISSFEEWILAPSETYLIRLTNTSGQAQVAGIILDMYDTAHAQ